MSLLQLVGMKNPNLLFSTFDVAQATRGVDRHINVTSIHDQGFVFYFKLLSIFNVPVVPLVAHGHYVLLLPS